MCVTSLLDKILRSYSSVEVKIPIDQADALPFQDRIKKPLGINEFRGDAPFSYSPLYCSRPFSRAAAPAVFSLSGRLIFTYAGRGDNPC